MPPIDSSTDCPTFGNSFLQGIHCGDADGISLIALTAIDRTNLVRSVSLSKPLLTASIAACLLIKSSM
jgi:hypothetical protein